jgi:hypothetical protein
VREGLHVHVFIFALKLRSKSCVGWRKDRARL